MAKKITSMDELLQKSGKSIKTFKTGDKIKAKFISIDSSSSLFDIGGKSEGIVSDRAFDEAKKFIETLKKGDEVEAYVVDAETKEGLVKLSIKDFVLNKVWQDLQNAKQQDKEVSVQVLKVLESGLIVGFEAGLTGFVPVSQLGEEAVKLGQKLLGNPLQVKIIEMDPQTNRLVFSEKAVSEAEELELEAKALAKVKEDQIYKGKVTNLTDFGAFVQIQISVSKKLIPVEGLVHISELSWEKISNPAAKLSLGDEVEVKVLEVDPEDHKLSLSVKQAKQDPWDEIEKKYSPEKQVAGTVTKKSNFGVFVQLEPGVEGLIHLTKLPPSMNLKSGDNINVFIEEVDAKERKISLRPVLAAKPIGYK